MSNVKNLLVLIFGILVSYASYAADTTVIQETPGTMEDIMRTDSDGGTCGIC